MRKPILGIGLFFLSFLLPTVASAATFDEIYVFGDSQVDDGNLFAATGGVVPQSPPYFNGRFSNGPIWVELLAPQLGLTANPATNFAFGGTTTGTTNVATGMFNVVDPLPGLLTQVDNFTTAFPTADPNALYIVEAGRLDYLMLGETETATVINNLSNAVTRLSTAGARNIMVANLLDLGKIPAGLASPSSDSLTNLTNQHNSNLAMSLQTLEVDLDINIIPLNFNSLFNEVLAEPGRFGFTDVTNSCLTSPGFLTPPFTECPNPDQFLFWDTQHTTAPAQRIFADFAFATLQAEPEPVPEPEPVLGTVMAVGFWCLLQRKYLRKTLKKVKKN